MTCSLLEGHFGILVQCLLGMMSVSILPIKFVWESWTKGAKARTPGTFFLDSSKQLIGAAWLHILNISFATASKGDPCQWYWINIMFDTTLGVGVEFLVLCAVRFALRRVPRSAQSAVVSRVLGGAYTIGGQFNCNTYFLQLSLWLFVVTVMKLINVALMHWSASWMLQLAHAVFGNMDSNPKLELIFVMVITPAIMNSLQFCVTDGFIKQRPQATSEAAPHYHDGESSILAGGPDTSDNPPVVSLAVRSSNSPWSVVLLRCAVPFLCGLVWNSCYLLVPLQGSCSRETTMDSDYFIASYVALTVLTQTPYYLVLCIGICPTTDHNGQQDWSTPLASACTAATLTLSGIILCKSFLNQQAVFQLGTTWACIASSIPVWLCYGISLLVFEYMRGSPSFSVPSLQQQAVENRIQMTHGSLEISSHLNWISSTDYPSGAFSNQSIVRPAFSQWLFLGLMLALENLPRFFMVVQEHMFYDYVTHHKRFDPDAGILYQFVRLIAVFAIWKTLLKAVGFACDSGRTGTCFSCYYAAYAIGTFAYYWFYRTLFEVIKSWRVFALMHSIHLISLWCKHVLPATSWFWQNILKRAYPTWVEQIVTVTSVVRQPNVSMSDWQCFMAVELALEFFCIIYTCGDFAFGHTIILFGYNSSLYARLQTVTTSNYQESMMKLMLQLVTEVINVGFIELWYRKKLGGMGALKRLNIILQSPQFLATYTLIGAAWGVCLWPAFLSDDFCN